jgi:hypothetical protein
LIPLLQVMADGDLDGDGVLSKPDFEAMLRSAPEFMTSFVIEFA